MAEIKIPAQAEALLDALQSRGHSAYVVGGCVRDSLLGREPGDWDICTSALPQETVAALQGYRVIPTGLKHGTVTVLCTDKTGTAAYEITTFRRDGEYKDNRRPERVDFVRNVREDLARRDFTVNAMAYNLREGLIDCFGGRQDLQNGVIACVGQPDLRFEEDALRLMRALRFASVYEFSIHPQTAEAIHRHRMRLGNIAMERIGAELLKLLGGDGVEKILLEYGDVFAVLIPELNEPQQTGAYAETAAALGAVQGGDNVVRLALLLQPVWEKSGTAAEILHRLRVDHKTNLAVQALLQAAKETPCAQPAALRHWLNCYGEAGTQRWLCLRRAKCAAQGGDPAVLAAYAQIEALINQILEEGQCYRTDMLQISGKELLALGAEGKQVGALLQYLLLGVLDGTFENARTQLLARAEEYLQGERGL